MSGETVLRCLDLRVDGGLVCQVSLCAATALNVVDRPWLERAAVELAALLARPGLRCVLVSGHTPRAFIGGANLHALAALDHATAEPFIRAVHRLCATLREASVPVLAVLRGHCLGAGLEIACACDVRIGDDSVLCGMPEVRVGLPSVVEAALLPGLIGWGKAREMMLRGHLIDAAEAAHIGLLQAVTSSADLDQLALRMARDVVAGAPGALAAQKRLFRRWEDSTVSAAIEHGVEALVAAYQGDEPARAIAAFFARKRAPRT